MESFGWKKKVQILKRNVSLIGDGDSDDENYRGPESERRNNMKSPRIQLDERKGQRLKEEGSVLAEAGKHELAIDKWRMALTYSPKDHSVYEMLAQVYMQLNELGSAVESATTATTLSPRSWENWQTLGRIQMNMGEVTLAVKSFSRAVLLCPQQRELWDEDLLIIDAILLTRLQVNWRLQNHHIHQQNLMRVIIWIVILIQIKKIMALYNKHFLSQRSQEEN
ncbi:tetratricopeptide repeat protein 33-like isoform X2 [Oratosquilla oratoria]|uniref:tetratricopeptide repeat protein 33-like isoform X2 n=1 Tax=Oratosquilla oratoria TaxID=337810 RepID=UPI003F7659F7